MLDNTTRAVVKKGGGGIALTYVPKRYEILDCVALPSGYKFCAHKSFKNAFLTNNI